MTIVTVKCGVLHESDSSDADFSMNPVVMMTMFERRPEVATPIIDGETAVSDGDNNSA
jgi:hypothetical protein